MPRPPRKADCHVDRKHFAKGMCQLCWKKSRQNWRTPGARATSKAYMRRWAETHRKPKGPQTPRLVTCHPERAHQAHGQCQSCYGRRRLYVRRYGITPAEYDQMYVAQGGLCAICEQPFEVLHVDHDHVTTVVRALLCKSCNIGIGHLNDSPERLFRAAEYLDNHRGQSKDGIRRGSSPYSRIEGAA